MDNSTNINALKQRYEALQNRRTELNTKRERILAEIKVQQERKDEILKRIKEISGKDSVEEAEKFLQEKTAELSNSLDVFEEHLNTAEKSLGGE